MGDVVPSSRGGGFYDRASYGRSADRDTRPPEARDYDIGLRPARAITD